MKKYVCLWIMLCFMQLSAMKHMPEQLKEMCQSNRKEVKKPCHILRKFFYCAQMMRNPSQRGRVKDYCHDRLGTQDFLDERGLPSDFRVACEVHKLSKVSGKNLEEIQALTRETKQALCGVAEVDKLPHFDLLDHPND